MFENVKLPVRTGRGRESLPSSEIEKEINPKSRICYLLASKPIWVKAMQHIHVLYLYETELPTGADFPSVSDSLLDICWARPQFHRKMIIRIEQ